MRLATAAVVAVLSVGFAACGEDKDADLGTREKGPADALNFPKNFPTVAHKCDGHGHRVYVVGHGSANPAGMAVIDDQSCEGPTR